MITFFKLLEARRLLVAATSLFLVLILSVGLAIYAEAEHQRQVTQTAKVQAQILADSVSAALAFDDVATIREYTAALRANPDIEAVAVYDNKGTLVSYYGPAPRPSELLSASAPHAGNTIAIRTPVVENGVPLGSIYFQQRAEAIGLRIARYSGAALLVVVASLMLLIMARDAQALERGNYLLRKEMADREQAEAALRQSQKMEAVGRLTGGIAHDFNNMLAVIIGNNDLMLRRFPDADPRLLKFVKSSQEAGRRAATLTSRLLAFSRRQPLDPKAVDVAKTVTETSGLLRRTLGETIHIETVHAAGLWRAHIDAGQLETALVNLAVNARDAMPQGGNLTIETSNATLDLSYTSGLEDITPGQYVLVAVTDTGTGMPPEIVQQVFEPFFTTKPVGQGTGLGLSQVHGFVKQSGGHVSIYSEVGHGTTIKLYLPRSTDVLDADPTEIARKAQSGRRGLTVLLVDDEPGLRDFTGEALIELGYDVLVAENGTRALDIIANNVPVHILLTDVIMPGLSGRQLADEVVKKNPQIRVLYMTGYTQNAIVHNGVLDVGTHLITKPFTIDHLEEQLDQLFR